MTSTSTTAIPIILECKDISEKIDLCESHSLYIKPIARLNITLQLPPTKIPGQTAPTTEIIEKLKKHSQPEEYIMLRIIKSTLEFIRFEAEIENKSALKNLISRLDNSSIKILSYTDVIKVRAAEAKIVYPLKHDWDIFFNCVNTNINDFKPGERPDTIHIQDLPIKWFSDKKLLKPSENILKEVFSIFGEIRCIDIPMLYNQKFYTQKSDTFDTYIQYKEYFSFVKAMDTFRGMKMLYIDNELKQGFTANIRVDFDRTKHLSEREIQKRSIDRLKSIELEKIRQAHVEKEKEKSAKIANYKQLLEDATSKDENTNASDKSIDETKTKEQRRKEREEIRRQKRLAKKQVEEEKKLSHKIALEERKILIAQRKLESMRLLEELFNRVKHSIMIEDSKKSEDSFKSSEEDKSKELINDSQESLNDLKENENEQKIIILNDEDKKFENEELNKENKLNENEDDDKIIEKQIESKNEENNEEKHINHDIEKDEQHQDLREKILSLKRKDDRSENEENDNEREDLRKRISGTKLRSSIVIKDDNESNSNDQNINKYQIDPNEKSLKIESND